MCSFTHTVKVYLQILIIQTCLYLMQYWRYACVNTASLQYWVSTLYAQDTTCLLLLTKRQHWSIGVARIFPGGTLFSSKSWWPFYSRCPQFTQAKIATLTTLTNQSSHNQEKFFKKLTSCCAWGDALTIYPYKLPQKLFLALGVHVHPVDSLAMPIMIEVISWQVYCYCLHTTVCI